MDIPSLLMRGYSYLYHLLLCLFLLGVSSLAYATQQHNLQFKMVPHTGEELSRVLLVSALIGLATVVLAVTGLFRFAFPFWAGLVVVQGVRWLLLNAGYVYPSQEFFKGMMWLLLGALGAFIGSLQLFKSKDRLRRERGVLVGVPGRRRVKAPVAGV